MRGEKAKATADSRMNADQSRRRTTNGMREGRGSDFYVRFGLRPAREPSAERNGFSLFAFPAMNRWAFFCRPAGRDFILVTAGSLGNRETVSAPHLPTSGKYGPRERHVPKVARTIACHRERPTQPTKWRDGPPSCKFIRNADLAGWATRRQSLRLSLQCQKRPDRVCQGAAWKLAVAAATGRRLARRPPPPSAPPLRRRPARTVHKQAAAGHAMIKPGEFAKALARMMLARCFADCRMATVVRWPAA